MTGIETKLALFNPTSLHNRFRARVRAEDKMRGFFHYLHRRQKQAEQGQTQHRPDTVQAEEHPERSKEGLSKPGNQERRLVLWADRPETPLEATLDLLFGTEDETRTIGLALQLANPSDFPAGTTDCRAYFLDGPVVARLKATAAAEEGSSLSSLRDVFQDNLMARSSEVARLLAAVPELDGIIDATGAGIFRSFPLPESCATVVLPEDVTIVVVISGSPNANTPGGENTNLRKNCSKNWSPT